MIKNTTNLDSLIGGSKAPIRDLSMNKALMFREIAGGSKEHTYGPAALVSFMSSKAKFVKSLLIDFQPIQNLNGYASPWPAGGGKNMIDDSKRYVSTNTRVYIGSETSACTVALSAGTYTASVDFSGEKYGMYYREANDTANTTILPSDTGVTERTFTIEEDGVFCFWVYRSANSGGVDPAKIIHVQIERGSTATSYTPYSNICPISGRTGANAYVSPTQDVADATTYPVTWQTEAGTVYGGTLDVVTGKLTVTMASVDLGTLNWGYNSAYEFFSAFIQQGATYSTPTLWCSDYKCGGYNIQNSAMGSAPNATVWKRFTNGLGNNANAIYVKDSRYSDADTYKSAMSGVQLVYELATPITYQLTPQEVLTLVGTNNVWSDSGDVTVKV